MRAGSFSLAPDERTSLLRRHVEDSTETLIEQEDESDLAEQSTRKVILREFWILFRSSIPVILAYTLQNSLQTFSVVIVGRLSPEALATSAFAYMFAMATGWLASYSALLM
jgi:MATE family multidrug resistance protein